MELEAGMQLKKLHALHDDESIWIKYREVLKQLKINEKAIKWYIKRAQLFLLEAKNTPLSELSGERMCVYLDRLSRTQKLNDWQLNQSIDAIFILVRDVFKCNWVSIVDWEGYKTHSPTLSPFHATLIRELDIPELIAATVAGFDVDSQANYRDVLTRLVRTLRVRNYAAKTEKTYLHWIKQFLYFCMGNDDIPISGQDVRLFLENLAIEKRVSPNTQKIALNAVAFLFRFGLEKEMGDFGDFVKARPSQRLPVVLSRLEVQDVFKHLSGTHYLMAGLL